MAQVTPTHRNPPTVGSFIFFWYTMNRKRTLARAIVRSRGRRFFRTDLFGPQRWDCRTWLPTSNSSYFSRAFSTAAAIREQDTAERELDEIRAFWLEVGQANGKISNMEIRQARRLLAANDLLPATTVVEPRMVSDTVE